MEKYIHRKFITDPLPAIAAGKTGEPITLSRGGELGIGTIKFSENPTADDTIVLNGVTVSFGPGNDVAIGVALTDTVGSLVTFLNASVNPALAVATYSKISTDTLRITYDTKTFDSADYTIVTTGLTAEPTSATDIVENGAEEPAIDLSSEYTKVSLNRASIAETATLPDGDECQRHTIYCAALASGNSLVVTPVNISGGSTLTFDAVGEFAELCFLAGEWRVISASSGVLA